MPSLDYKNTNFALVPEQTGIMIINEVSEYPLSDFNLNPIYFSWNIFIKKDLLNKKNIEFNVNDKNYKTNYYDIMPDTFISKLTHVSNENFLKSKIFISHHANKKEIISNLSKYITFFQILRFLIFFIYTSLFIYVISINFKN